MEEKQVIITQQDEFIGKLQELLQMADPYVDTVTKVGENIEVKYKDGYIKTIPIETDDKAEIIAEVARRV